MKYIVKLLLSITLMGYAAIAMAQVHPCNGPGPRERMVGEQPAGNGVGPIPLCVYENNNKDNNYAPPPPVKWADRWGAIALGSDSNKNGVLGVSVNIFAKAAAEAFAMNDCNAKGGGDTCHIVIVYHNQCAALAVPEGYGSATSAGDPDLNKAKQRVIEGCTQAGGKDCHVIYSACSTAVRVQ